MPPRTRKMKQLFTVSGVLVGVTAITSSYLWWNTDVLGADSFCGGRLNSADVRAALDSTGRLGQAQSHLDPGLPEYTCTVERTSRFVGGKDQQLTVKTSSEQGAFPFTTSVWKSPATRSYFTNGLTGAVSDSGGYVVLPKACWDKVGALQGNRVVRAGKGAVAAVEATVTQGRADRTGLARLLAHSAQQIARKAGCANPGTDRAPGLGAPAARRTTDVQSVCGLRGFALPEAAVLVGRAEPDAEQINTATAHTWACDLQLAGSARASMSFTATTDGIFAHAALSGPTRFQKLPSHRGETAPGQAVLHCRDNDVYFAARWNSAYEGALLESVHHSAANYAKIKRNAFQNFLNATASRYACPSVDLP
ncbi:hypothetical protein EDD94_8004 [Streptomyces sp. PanSC9]|nr:hypothetical protein EDD94_8004 [Streptomyces sp. PanSC9]